MKSLLKKIYLFSDFSDQEISDLAQIVKEKDYISGQELFFSGEKANAMYLISSGTVKIIKSTDEADEIVLSTVAGGEHFGEMSFLTGEPRSATARIVESSHVLEIFYNDLAGLMKANINMSEKFHKSMARFLAKRLVSTTLELKNAIETL